MMLEQRSVREIGEELAKYGNVRIPSPTGLSMDIPSDERELLSRAARLVMVDIIIRRVGDEVWADVTG